MGESDSARAKERVRDFFSGKGFFGKEGLKLIGLEYWEKRGAEWEDRKVRG